jgi:hypothetical protein
MGRRRVFGGAQLRVGSRAPFSGRVVGLGPREAWVCVPEADAVMVRDGALERAGITIRLSSDDGDAWTPVVDLRMGAAHGSGDNAVRLVLVTTTEGWPSSANGADDLVPVLVAADDERAIDACRAMASLTGVEIVHVRDVSDPQSVGALLLGCASGPEAEVESVRSMIERLPGMRPILFARGGAASERWSDVVSSGQVFFACSGWPAPDRLGPLALAALENAVFRRVFRELVRPRPDTEDGFPAFAWYDATSLGERRAAQSALRDLAAQAERRMPDVTATVYAYDDWAEILLGPHLVQQEEFAESAALGLIAYAARSGTAVLDEAVEDSVFFDPELDLVPGAGRGLMAVPVRDPSGTVFGVLACHAADAHDHVRPELLDTARLLASDFAPPLAVLREHARLQGDAGVDSSVFRAEAIAEQRRSESPSAILNVSERWGSWIVGGMAALLLAFVAFLVFGTATEYAEGTAVVHSRGRISVVANEGGTVAAIHIAPQTEVSPGDVIGTLYDHAELAQVRRLEREYEDALVRLLRDPDDRTVGDGLAALRSASEQARADLDERQLVVPVRGILTDVRVRPGTLVSPGQTVATVGTAGPGFEIVAAVPGNFRPLLGSGVRVVAELEQFPGSRFHLQAREVSPEVISVGEARALMGQLLPTADEDAALALVYADLPGVLVSSAGAEYPLYDGMRGSVRIPVREERFIVTLWPTLASGR